MKTTSNNSNNLNRLNKLNLALLLALSTSLIGCSGGGSSNPGTPVIDEGSDPDTDPGTDPGTDPEPTTPEALELTASDALDYGVAFQRAMYVFIETLQPYANGDQPHELVQEVFYYPQAAKLAYDNVIQPNAACESGTATPQMVDLNSDGQVTEDGESMSYNFEQCVLGNMTFNGQLAYSYQTPEDGDYQLQFTYTNLTVQTPDGEISLDGIRSVNMTSSTGQLILETTVGDTDLAATAPVSISAFKEFVAGTMIGNELKVGYTQSYQRIGNEWQLSISGNNVMSVDNKQATLTTTQSEANAFKGLVENGTDNEPYQGEYQIRWDAGEMALVDKALNFQSVASTQVTEDYQVKIDFLDNADESTVTESFKVNWAGTPIQTP